jgi:hypothetical protein
MRSSALALFVSSVITAFARPELAQPGGRAGRLHPMFTVCGEDFVMATHLLAAIRFIGLGRALESLASHRSEIIGALDVLLVGV